MCILGGGDGRSAGRVRTVCSSDHAPGPLAVYARTRHLYVVNGVSMANCALSIKEITVIYAYINFRIAYAGRLLLLCRPIVDANQLVLVFGNVAIGVQTRRRLPAQID